jgi:molybdate transport system substrate-binding protein
MKPKLGRAGRAVLLLVTLALGACQPAQPQAVTLTVMAAASLTAPFEQLGAQFEADHPGVTVQFNIAGSQQLAQQLAQGAQADVFASAGKKPMDTAVEAGRVSADAARPFAGNRLALVVPAANPAGLADLTGLAQPGLKLVLAAPEVPVGNYTLQLLELAAGDPAYGAAYREAVLANVVSYEENVKSVLAKVALGEADAGFVYVSDLTGQNGDQVREISIPESLNVTASYPIAALRDAPNAELAQAFVELVLSDEGQAVLQQANFLPAR